MSLIKCCECNTKVSEYADKCPNCGCPMSVIKENNQNDNKYLITFVDNVTIDLTDIENKITEDDMKTMKLWKILHEEYNADIATCSVIDDMFKFNNYKFPDNYQDLYEAMCEHNVKSREAREASLPKCPHCNSINISKISTTERVGSIAMLGIFSKKINKSFKCKHCGYTW